MSHKAIFTVLSGSHKGNKPWDSQDLCPPCWVGQGYQTSSSSHTVVLPVSDVTFHLLSAMLPQVLIFPGQARLSACGPGEDFLQTFPRWPENSFMLLVHWRELVDCVRLPLEE